MSNVFVVLFQWLFCYDDYFARCFVVLRENPDKTFYWFFQASCPIARDKGGYHTHTHWLTDLINTHARTSLCFLRMALPVTWQNQKNHTAGLTRSSEREKAGELVSMLSSAINRVVIGNTDSIKRDGVGPVRTRLNYVDNSDLTLTTSSSWEMSWCAWPGCVFSFYLSRSWCAVSVPWRL